MICSQGKVDATGAGIIDIVSEWSAAMKPKPEVLPYAPYNETLVANVHPPDWDNPKPAGRYNLVVIGAGTAGLITAAGAAGLGARVALIEHHLMGGDCLNVGCVSSKGIAVPLKTNRRKAVFRSSHYLSAPILFIFI
jgi:hypothetical protein